MEGKKIPITAAKEIATKYGYTQIVIHGYDGSSGIQSVATYGKSLEDCENAAQGGNVIKRLLGWDEELCHVQPKRVKKKEQLHTL